MKKGAAETEEAWQGAGQEVGLQIWRIVNFKVRELCKYKLILVYFLFILPYAQSQVFLPKHMQNVHGMMHYAVHTV